MHSWWRMGGIRPNLASHKYRGAEGIGNDKAARASDMFIHRMGTYGELYLGTLVRDPGAYAAEPIVLGIMLAG